MNMIHQLKELLQKFFIEGLIIVLLCFVIDNYTGHRETRITADGIGYFEYLPSIFIHDDFIRKDASIDKNPEKYERLSKLENYVDHKDRWVNKYAVGTAILQSPFFLYSLATTDRTNNLDDGYQPAFQWSVFYASLFYLFFSLYFFKQLLVNYKISNWIILLSQILLVFSTSVVNYINFDPSFSHVYSLFAVTGFILYARYFFENPNSKHFIFSSILLGLIFLIRPVNIIVIFALPFIAGSWIQFKDGILYLLKKRSILVFGIILFFLMASLQFLMYYLQTGSWFLDSYPNEKFNFLEPHFFDVLFSYRKGLFVYAPILFIATLSVLYWIKNKEWFLLISWLGFFLILTYIISSWWSWYYGCSYGMRTYIEFYPLFFIPFTMFLARSKKVIVVPIVLISLFTIPVSLIQTYQYKAYILHWMDMNETKYWNVFLQTEEQFEGLVWKEPVNESIHQKIESHS
jgi:hypothetical protein